MCLKRIMSNVKICHDSSLYSYQHEHFTQETEKVSTYSSLITKGNLIQI